MFPTLHTPTGALFARRGRHALAALVLCAVLFPAAAQRTFRHRFESVAVNTQYFEFFKMAAAADGGWAAANCDSATREIVVLRFDSCGDLAWSKTLVAPSPYRPLRCGDVFFDPDGDLLVGAGISYNNFGYFHLIRLDPAGQLRWTRSWQADRLGPGVFSMGRLPGGHYFFAGINHPPSGPHDFVGITDSSGQLLSVRTYYRSSAGYQTVATALRDGGLVVRRGPAMYKIEPLGGTVAWSRAYLAPLYNHSKPLELDSGLLVVGQFANSIDRYSAVPLFFAADGQLDRAGAMFRANGGGLSNILNLQIRRVEALADGNFVTVTTDSMPAGSLSVVIFDPAGELVRQTYIASGLPGVPLLNHDFCLLPNGGLAVAANAGGRLAVIKTGPDPATLCGARPGLNPVPYQSSLSEEALDITVDTFPFEPIDVDFVVSDFNAGRIIDCDTTRPLPDRDTLLRGCPGDTLWADAFYPSATRYVWENGSDSVRVRILPGQQRVAVVWVECRALQHRFEARAAENCPCPLELPNVFSPNGDELNDVFRPVGDCAFEQFELTVFNRWGQRVFATSDPDAGWNGQHGGRDLPADVYAYRLEYRVFGGSQQQRSGDVTLVR